MPGHRGLFIPGPTNVPQAVRLAMDISMEDQRAPDLPAFTLPLFADVKKVFKTDKAQVFLFPASGTGGWEAAMTNTLSPGDKVLIARFGQFSLLWADMCTRMGLEVDVVDVPWGEGVPVEIFAEKLKADKAHAYKAVLVTHNETATGVTSDVACVRKAMDDAHHPALLFVDAVSSLASIDFRMDEWNVDICVSGSQKGFMMPAGLAILAVSEKALAARKAASMRRCYFDFEDMMKTNKDGFFPYTPPLHMLRALRAATDLLLTEGLDNVFARHDRHAEATRRAVRGWGLEILCRNPAEYSSAVTAVMMPTDAAGKSHDADVLRRIVLEHFNMSLGAGLAKLAGRVFRIGHLGDFNDLTLIGTLGGVEMGLQRAGVPHTRGGTQAAIDYLAETARQPSSV